jgi:hypothetical protein
VLSEDKSEPVQFLNSNNNHSKRIPLLRWFVAINWKSLVSTESIGSPRSRPNFFLSSFFFFSARGEQRFEKGVVTSACNERSTHFSTVDVK